MIRGWCSELAEWQSPLGESNQRLNLSRRAIAVETLQPPGRGRAPLIRVVPILTHDALSRIHATCLRFLFCRVFYPKAGSHFSEHALIGDGRDRTSDLGVPDPSAPKLNPRRVQILLSPIFSSRPSPHRSAQCSPSRKTLNPGSDRAFDDAQAGRPDPPPQVAARGPGALPSEADPSVIRMNACCRREAALCRSAALGACLGRPWLVLLAPHSEAVEWQTAPAGPAPVHSLEPRRAALPPRRPASKRTRPI